MKLTKNEYHKLSDSIFEDLVSCGVTDNEEENQIAFDDVLSNKLSRFVDWNN